MKKYHLAVFTNAQTTPWTYEIIADYFEWSSSGCYIFYTQDKVTGRNHVTCTYPISRTIIKQIEDYNE